MTNRHVAELFAVGHRARGAVVPHGPERRGRLPARAGPDRTRCCSRSRASSMVHPTGTWRCSRRGARAVTAAQACRRCARRPAGARGRRRSAIRRSIPATTSSCRTGSSAASSTSSGCSRASCGERRDIQSFGTTSPRVTHDSSTLGGNSGSAVIDIETGTVVGLHFAGRYLEANYAVPTHELALDRRVVEAGVNFEAEIGGAGADAVGRFWSEADPRRSRAAADRRPARRGTARSPRADGQLDDPAGGDHPDSQPGAGAAGSRTPMPAIEAMVEPFHDEDFSAAGATTTGFLGLPVPLPKVLDEGLVSQLDDGSHVLPYEHFSVVVDKGRRLALFTASNVDADPRARSPSPGATTPGEGLTGLGENDQREVVHRSAHPGRAPAPGSVLHEGSRVVRQGAHREAGRRRVGRHLRRGAARERRHLPRDQLLAAGRQLQPLRR